jgi:regulator of replication initiation timing
MTPELHDLAEKIERLAALADTLRRENADLRHKNAQLNADNEGYRQRLGEAQRRVETLLASLPEDAADAGADQDDMGSAADDGTTSAPRSSAPRSSAPRSNSADSEGHQ